MRYTYEVSAYEVQVYEAYVYKVQTYKVYAYEVPNLATTRSSREFGADMPAKTLIADTWPSSTDLLTGLSQKIRCGRHLLYGWVRKMRLDRKPSRLAGMGLD